MAYANKSFSIPVRGGKNNYHQRCVMQNIDMRKIYNFRPVDLVPETTDLPTGGDIYYECLECATIINSLPYIKSKCSCGNLEGSGGGGKLTIKDKDLVRVVRGSLK